jgi:hypothetical protein
MVNFTFKFYNFDIRIRTFYWNSICKGLIKVDIEVWLGYYYFIYWKLYITEIITQLPTLITNEKDFVDETYPDPEIDLPDLWIDSPFTMKKQVNLLQNKRLSNY